MRKNKQRLDKYLVDNGYFENAEEVKRSVIAHEVCVGTTYVSSAAQVIELDENNISKQAIKVKNKKEFVSRGGHKLQAAIDNFSISVIDKKCLDIGSSTGGFTDCLLQAGASEVTCVDVNYGQLAWVIRQNNKVKVFERLNIKDAVPKTLGAPFDIVVTDVSFISLASISEVVKNMCCTESIFIGLIKPQFECKKGETQNGVVVNEEVRMRTIEEVKLAYTNSGFQILNVAESPIKGPAGNIEYLLYAVKN